MKIPAVIEKYKKYIIVSIIFLILVIIMYPSYRAVIKSADGKYYNAIPVITVGDIMLCMKGSDTYKTSKGAKSQLDSMYWPAIVSMEDIAFIEIIPETDDGDVLADGKYIPGSFLGKYKINATGHAGYLYLSVRAGRLYGTIHFPSWAKGQYERLKGVKITGDRITFTRSVTTRKELLRIGADSYFTQNYKGKYYSRGKYIEGTYYSRGAEFMWEAKK